MSQRWRRLLRRLPPIQRRERSLARQAEDLERQRKLVTALREDLDKQRLLSKKHQTTIRSLRSKLDASRAELARAEDVRDASYRVALRQHVRVIRAQRAADQPSKHPTLQLRYKMYIYELAASHGIPVPEVYAVWTDIAAIDLTRLPDEFVLKADGGSNGRSVLPLQRIAHHQYRRIDGKDVYTAEDIKALLNDLGRNALPPFFAEELLRSVSGHPVPDDVKFYMFHGVMGQALLRSTSRPTTGTVLPARFIDASGADFGPVPVGRPYDPTIPIPRELGALIETARHASRAVGIPFCRVDLYETSRGVVLGEITAAPSSGREKFTPNHDAQLGNLWIDATVRLEQEIADGRPPGIVFGPRDETHLYPATDDPKSPSNFVRVSRPCHEWC